MARGVLGAVRSRVIIVMVVLAAVAVPAVAAEPEASNCSGASAIPAARKKEAQEFLQRVAAGPFFKELVRRKGKPTSCQIGVDGSNLTLIYTFRRKARLEARANSSIEYSQERMQLQGLDRLQALELLKESEKDAFGAQGCGINWQQPSEESPGEKPGTREVVYRGDTCNCQGRLVYSGDAVIALVSSSAC